VLYRRAGHRHDKRGHSDGKSGEPDCSRRFGTARQKMVLERGTNPKRSRRTCSPWYGLQSWGRYRRASRNGLVSSSPEIPSVTIRNFCIAVQVNSRTHVPQTHTGSISLYTKPVSIVSVSLQTVPNKAPLDLLNQLTTRLMVWLGEGALSWRCCFPIHIFPPYSACWPGSFGGGA
jgi:hypothetical protein